MHTANENCGFYLARFRPALNSHHCQWREHRSVLYWERGALRWPNEIVLFDRHISCSCVTGYEIAKWLINSSSPVVAGVEYDMIA